MIKKILAFVLAFILIMSMGAAAFAEDVYWELDKDGVLYIHGKGEIPDFVSVQKTPWIKDRARIKSIIIDDGITYIGNNAFNDCSNVTYVRLPDSVESIGNYSFYSCSKLSEIILPKNLRSIGKNSFDHCVKLTTVFIPEKVRTIEQCAFNGCIRLKLVGIPASVSVIENSAFNDCADIETVYYGGSAREWDKIDLAGFNKNLREADRIDNVIYEAFNTGYWAIGENGVMIITGFGSIRDFDRPSDAGWSRYSSRVYSVIFDDNIEGIGANAFAYFKNLQEAKIPSSVKYIGDNAFANCTSMKRIVYGGRIENWESIEFGYNAIPYSNKDFMVIAE